MFDGKLQKVMYHFKKTLQKESLKLLKNIKRASFSNTATSTIYQKLPLEKNEREVNLIIRKKM
jgi:hypothetical protein